MNINSINLNQLSNDECIICWNLDCSIILCVKCKYKYCKTCALKINNKCCICFRHNIQKHDYYHSNMLINVIFTIIIIFATGFFILLCFIILVKVTFNTINISMYNY